MSQPTAPKPAASGAAANTPSLSNAIRTLDSQELLGSQGVAYIRHQGEVYRLQTTRLGKLILTK